MDPDGDFVKRFSPDDLGSTRAITPEERQAIKQVTGRGAAGEIDTVTDDTLPGETVKAARLDEDLFDEENTDTETERELEEEEELDDIERCCVKLRVEGDDIQCSAHLPKDDVAVDPETRHAKGLLHDCAWNFDIFRKAHPEVTEIHYYTDDELLMEE
jgi:hypothetical protein